MFRLLFVSFYLVKISKRKNVYSKHTFGTFLLMFLVENSSYVQSKNKLVVQRVSLLILVVFAVSETGIVGASLLILAVFVVPLQRMVVFAVFYRC